MATPPDPQRKKDHPAAGPPAADENVEAYELDEQPKTPPKPAEAPKVNRSYLVDVPAPPLDPQARREEGAKKMLGGSDGPPVAPADPAALARKREEARKRGAELWALEEAQRRKRKLITLAVLVIVTIAAVVVWMR